MERVTSFLGAWGSLVASVPVDPGAEEARRWAEDELSRAEYREGASLAEWFVQALSDLIDTLFSQAGGGGLAPLGYLLGVLALAALLAVAWVVARPMLSTVRRESAVVLSDDTRTAAQIDESARAAADAERWHDAVLETFRAIVRGAEERTVIDARDGRTAHEAAVDIAAVLPGTSAPLAEGARRFDAICYSDAVATRHDYEAARVAADAVSAARIPHEAPA